MNFFESQDRAKKKTAVLVFFFILAVLCLILMTEILVIVIFSLFETQSDPALVSMDDFTNSANFGVLITVAIAIILVVGLACLFKMLQLRSGGAAVAAALNGRLLNNDTQDLEEKKLLNIVEEMAIASGIPVPPVYLMEEDAINAFAAGYNINNAVIGLTRGAIHNLKREELQGVIAHEFSHILHGDMRLNIKLIAVLHGIMFLGMLGYLLMRSSAFSRRSSKDSAAPMLAMAFGLIVIGYAGTFFGNIIKAAVSRQREFLADASAVQYTRNPFGISSALKKIGGLSAGSLLRHPDAREISHLLFGQGVKSFFGGIFSTHPPLHERIKRIEPGWDGKFLYGETAADATFPAAQAAAAVAGFAPSVSTTNDASFIDAIGQPGEAQLQQARKILQQIPPPLLQMAHQPYGARAVIFLLLLSVSESVKSRQLNHLQSGTDPQVMGLLEKLVPQYAPVSAVFRLPLLDICVPSLKQLSKQQYIQFKKNILTVIVVDNKVELFEWSLLRILEQCLEPAFGRHAKTGSQYKSLQPVAGSCHRILSALAMVDSDTDEQARQAYAAGWQKLGLSEFMELDFGALENMRSLDQAIAGIAQLHPLQKPRFIKACCRCAEAHNDVDAEEIEMIRAIAACIDVPVPPHLENQALL